MAILYYIEEGGREPPRKKLSHNSTAFDLINHWCVTSRQLLKKVVYFEWKDLSHSETDIINP